MKVAIIQTALVFDPFPTRVASDLELDGEGDRSQIISSTRKISSVPSAGDLRLGVYEELEM